MKSNAFKLHSHAFARLLVNPSRDALASTVATAIESANRRARTYLVAEPRNLAAVMTTPEGILHASGGCPRTPPKYCAGIESSLGIAWNTKNGAKRVVIVSRRGFGRVNAFVGPGRQENVSACELIEACVKRYKLTRP